jgi:LysR family glycine cleavage system transcriptional activator
MNRLPPLKSLTVFEAAARLESFNGAADELNVTPSAVSHQVKALEESIGVQLFRRLNRRVALTPEGRVYLPPIRAALEQIRLATDQIRSRDSLGVVTLSSAPSFAIGWLMPRLPQFQMLHPDIEVRLISAIELVDFATSDVDAGIRTGRGDWPGLCSHRLMTEELVPVCSSEYAKANGGLDRPGRLKNTTLLHELPRLGQWRTWLSAVGVEGVDAERGPKFQGAAMAVEAAIAGMGVALANRRLVERHVEEGRLKVPFDIELPTESAFYFVYPQDRADDPRVSALKNWMLTTMEVESD